MGKKKPAAPPTATKSLFKHLGPRNRRALILPRYLADEGDKFTLRGPRQEAAYAALIRWADMELAGQLDKKETALGAGFLHEIFAAALGYPAVTQSPERYRLERNYTVPGVGVADAALGDFGPGRTAPPVVVIELKDAGTDLDRDKFNGRTPVQQCWDYLNALPECP